MPREPTASARFEGFLLEVARGPLDSLAKEPALASMQGLLVVLDSLMSSDPNVAGPALDILRDLHMVFQWARARGDSWIWCQADARAEPAGRLKRTLELRDEHVPARLKGTFELAQGMWPVLPLASWLFDWLRSNLPAELVDARFHEYLFVLICTRPGTAGAATKWLHILAADQLKWLARTFPGLDHIAVATKVVESFERRPLPVRRYQARARTREEAAAKVRQYVVRSIRRRANDVIRRELEGAEVVPASTVRRWKMEGTVLTSPDDAVRVRKEKQARQKHVTDGCYSVAWVARTSKRARSVVQKALARAERRYGFKARTGPRATLLTLDQVKLLAKFLPPRKLSSNQGGTEPPSS